MFPCTYGHQRVDSFSPAWGYRCHAGFQAEKVSIHRPAGKPLTTRFSSTALCYAGTCVVAGKRFRVISTALLSTLLHLHMRPIHQVVFLVPQGRSYLGNRLALRCFQRLSVPCLATRRYCGHNNRYTSGTSFPVLSY